MICTELVCQLLITQNKSEWWWDNGSNVKIELFCWSGLKTQALEKSVVFECIYKCDIFDE